jgi:hypothetical protein
VIQEVTATRDAEPNSAPVPQTTPEEVSSGAALGGTDMRPAIVPLMPLTSRIEVQLDCTLECDLLASTEQVVDVSLQLSDDDGANWVELREVLTAIIMNRNQSEGAASITRNDFRLVAGELFAVVFPDYVPGTPVLARVEVSTPSATVTTVVSEGNPGNCRVVVREVLA